MRIIINNNKVFEVMICKAINGLKISTWVLNGSSESEINSHTCVHVGPCSLNPTHCLELSRGICFW